MKHTRTLLSGIGLVAALVLFLALNLLANTGLTGIRLDMTEARLYTLSEGSRNILAALDEPIQLRFYFSNKGLTGLPTLAQHGAHVRDLLLEYQAAAHGKIDLHIVDPEPFSEAEDEAVGFGIQRLPLNTAGEMAYLGLVGTNSTDDRQAIPVFHPDREDALEYELTKLVYTLAKPKKRVIGLISGLPLTGALGDLVSGEGTHQAWVVFSLLQQIYEVRDLGLTPTEIDKGIDTLLIVHPKGLPRLTQYLVDQFVLKGGKALVFVDPLAESDRPTANPDNPMVMPKSDSDLPELFKAWGVRLVPDKIAGDLASAIRITRKGGPRGPQEVEYLIWLGLGKDNFNAEDFATNKLETVNVGSAGVLEPVPEAGTRLTPLLRTTPKSMLVERDAAVFVRDPAVLLEGFKPSGKEMVLAAALDGPAKTAFPNGRPLAEQEKTAPPDPGFIHASQGPINVVVVADTDLLADRFWVRMERMGRLQIPSPVADNADLVLNLLDRLGGNADLIGLRSRKASHKPFLRVEAVRREAEAGFRNQERALMAKLEDTERQIKALEKEKAAGSSALLTPEQRQAIEGFRTEQVKTRRELRTVQHDLKKNIEQLGAWLKFIHIGLVPLAVALVVLGGGAWAAGRRRRPRPLAPGGTAAPAGASGTSGGARR
jgi:ABC-type uncharacterized transport system involved in gliding motility auxiliary subunit